MSFDVKSRGQRERELQGELKGIHGEINGDLRNTRIEWDTGAAATGSPVSGTASGGSSAGGATELGGLSDVTLTSPGESHVLRYDPGDSMWKNRQLQFGDLGNTLHNTHADKQVWIFSDPTDPALPSEWVNRALTVNDIQGLAERLHTLETEVLTPIHSLYRIPVHAIGGTNDLDDIHGSALNLAFGSQAGSIGIVLTRDGQTDPITHVGICMRARDRWLIWEEEGDVGVTSTGARWNSGDILYTNAVVRAVFGTDNIDDDVLDEPSTGDMGIFIESDNCCDADLFIYQTSTSAVDTPGHDESIFATPEGLVSQSLRTVNITRCVVLSSVSSTAGLDTAFGVDDGSYGYVRGAGAGRFYFKALGHWYYIGLNYA